MEHVDPRGGSSFDTSKAGTSERSWAALTAPAWSPPVGPLVVVAPHPDDETLGAGGLIHTWAARSLPVVIISITNGEAACPEVRDLAVVRRGELLAARDELAPAGIDIVHLNLPDGGVNEHAEEVANAIRAITPRGATLIAPFEHDGHPDHDAAGRIARDVAASCNATLAQYPIWAWHHATPHLFAGERLGRFALSFTAQRAKQTAIQQFRSQLRDRPGGAIVPEHVLGHFARSYEVFVL
jgi:LmbE family N-acetylglucosaminyl deacetylase